MAKANEKNKIKSRTPSNDEGLVLSTFIWVAFLATPFLWNGRWVWGLLLSLIVLIIQICRQSNRIEDREKWKIRFNIMEPVDIVQTISKWETPTTPINDLDSFEFERCILIVSGLAALAKKFNAVRERSSRTSLTDISSKTRAPLEVNALALLCQEAVYVAFRCQSKERNSPKGKMNEETDECNAMEMYSAAIALLALVAKNSVVRERHRYEADLYGLDIPVRIMRQLLETAKGIQSDKGKNDDQEQQAAEVLRKSCLLLGALAEGDADLAQLIGGEGGVEFILEAALWYRFHAGVANWALWALFILCFEYLPNKVAFCQEGGVAAILEILRHVSAESLEATRHGVALLFDLLREKNDGEVPEDPALRARLDAWQIRKVALAAGLHNILLHAMRQHTQAMDIVMMGSEILLGTGYQGEIPTLQPPEFHGIER